MEHDKGSDNTGGFGKDVDKFRDNTEGSISLKEFLEQVGRCGERIAGSTGKKIYAGTQGLINANTTHEEITIIYDDLITARSRGGTYDKDAYEWLFAETDSDYNTHGRRPIHQEPQPYLVRKTGSFRHRQHGETKARLMLTP